MTTWRFGLKGHGMHDFIIREFEIGYRAASCEDSEHASGWTAIDFITYQEYLERETQALGWDDLNLNPLDDLRQFFNLFKENNGTQC